ncbi:allatostatins [Cephus cinctus]|uniref:Allatostatins n=1 Tax=Cephus cinctus TaxID=211228 RepID=A0AAJ7C9Z5_CEPCN|nr:allatostatins [Cephus cinctus]
MRATTTLGMGLVLLMTSGSITAMEESVLTDSEESLGDLLNDLGLDESPEKRAYTYVSQYKRLPLYNFGIGKRWSPEALGDTIENKRARLYSFGLGKRARPFSFGLGKRGLIMQQELPNVNVPKRPGELMEDKRNGRMYSFGLGKRLANNDNELDNKRGSESLRQRYMFGLGKRVNEEEDTVA